MEAYRAYGYIQYAGLYVCIYVCTFVCVCVCVCIYIYIYIHIHTYKTAVSNIFHLREIQF